MGESFIIQWAERFFALLHWVSPSKQLKSLLRIRSGYRPLHGFIDAYVIGSLCLAAALLVASSRWPAAARHFWYLPVAIAVVRIVEILGMSFDVLVFDRVRSECQGTSHLVPSWERTLLLGLINYLELILYFALIYFVAVPYAFNEAFRPEVVWDAVFFSTVTLTTVGYGDIQALTTASRMCAIAEALVGLLALTLIISRVVSILPVSPAKNRVSG